METLAEYEDEIVRLVNAVVADPDKPVPHPNHDPELDSEPWEWTQAEDSRCKLRELSCSVRRKCWSNRDRARVVADYADEAASRIEAVCDLMPTARMPRFDPVYSGGIWSPAVA